MDVPVQSLTCTASGRPEQVLAQHLGLSRRVVTNWLRAGQIRTETGLLRKGDRIDAGEPLYLSVAGRLGDWVQPEMKPTALLASGEDWLAINKHPGMPSHLNMPFESQTALNHFVAHDPCCATAGDDPLQGSLVHRLDNEASGVLLAARPPQAYEHLRAAFSAGDVHRVYRARVTALSGVLPAGQGECRLALSARGAHVRVDPDGRATHTLWRTLDDHGLLELEIKTGHRHQIRVHLASQDWPILGDVHYGGAPHERLALHCTELAWSNQRVVSPIPKLLEPRH